MKQIRRKIVVPLLLLTAATCFARDPLRNAIALLMAGLVIGSTGAAAA